MAKTKMSVVGFQEFLDQLTRAGQASGKVVGHALYYGADVVADALRAETEGLPVDNGTDKTRKRGLTQYEKAGLVESLGISKARSEGDHRTISVGFDGYNGHETDRWAGGVPNVVVARSLQTGTSFMRRNPFITRAARRSKAAAEAAMKAAAEAVIEEDFK